MKGVLGEKQLRHALLLVNQRHSDLTLITQVRRLTLLQLDELEHSKLIRRAGQPGDVLTWCYRLTRTVRKILAKLMAGERS